MKIRAYAKINLTLDITSKRDDGYHDVKMIMQEISLYDTIDIERSDDIEIECNIPYIPCDERNLAYKAVLEFNKYTNKNAGAKIYINKIIPSGAGLGGGSSDAAAVVKALDKLYNTNLTERDKMNICEKLGSDVPFFILGGTCLAEGRGEILTKLPSIPKCYVLLAKPSFSVSTKIAYQNFDITKLKRHPETDAAIEALKSGDIVLLAEKMKNVLEPPVVNQYPKIKILKYEIKKGRALNSIMTGSGSTVFGIFDSYTKASLCKEKMRNIADFVFLCEAK